MCGTKPIFSPQRGGDAEEDAEKTVKVKNLRALLERRHYGLAQRRDTCRLRVGRKVVAGGRA
jgi:hypothetical protein